MQKKTLIFDSEVNGKSVTDLIYDIDLANPFHEEHLPTEFTIYFTTVGGVVSHGYLIVDYLIRLVKAGHKIHFVVTDVCFSTGLLVLVGLYQKSHREKCQSNVNFSFFKYSKGLFHETAVTLHTREDKSQIPVMVSEMAERESESLKFFRKHMTKAEIATFKAGGDVLFDHTALCKIFNGKLIEIL